MPPVKHALACFHYGRKNASFPKSFSNQNSEDQALLLEIQQKGYAVLPEYFNAAFCDNARNAIDAAIKKFPEYIHKREDERLFAAQNICDEIAEFNNDKRFQALSDAYYGTPTTVGVSLANRIKGDGGKDALGSGGDWHRDRMLRQFKTIMYLDDVTENDGPFQYIENSNMTNTKQFSEDSKITGMPDKITRLTAKDVDPLIAKQPDRFQSFTAKKGTVILVDTSGLHRGCPVYNGKRYALFNYYYPVNEFDQEKSDERCAPLMPAGIKNKLKA